MGKEYFDNNREFDNLRNPSIPFVFIWLFNTFTELYQYCGESITWTQIQAYANLRKIEFTQRELDYILLMNSWANHQIRIMRDEADKKEEED